MRQLVFLSGILLFTASLFAQNKFTLSGYVKDSLSEETLIGATVAVTGAGKGISSNQYGFYSITLPEGVYTVAVSFVGYHSKQVEINLNANTQFNFQLLQR